MAKQMLADAVAEAAALIGEGNDSQAFRILADCSVRMENLSSGQFTAAAAVDPGSTGYRKWDALVAGIVERLCHIQAVPIPPWTVEESRFSPVWWFVTQYPSLRASALVHSPRELANRGVFCHPESLTGV